MHMASHRPPQDATLARRAASHRDPPGRGLPLTLPSARFRPDIEGLRGIAVLLVVAYHAGFPLARGGFIGVDVFFVLSGYLITGLLVAEAQQTGRVRLLEFYARRVRRLLPAAVLTLVAVVAAGAVVFSPMEQVTFARTARATSLYVSNIWFLRHSADYFAPELEANPLLHTWSLAVEEQFYLLWPLMVMLAVRRARRQSSLVATMSGLVVVSLGLATWLAYESPRWAFFSLPTRVWEFGIGGLACLLPSAAFGSAGLHALLGGAGLLAVLASACILSAASMFPGATAVPAVVGTALVLTAGAANARGLLQRMLGSRQLQWFGRLSYSWYLWHWPALVLTAAVQPGLSSNGRWGAVVISLGLAAATARMVENPIRFSSYLVARPALSLAMGAVLTVAGVGCAAVWHTLGSRVARSAEQRRFSELALKDFLEPHSACMLNFEIETPSECVLGDVTASDQVVLFGDSHAAQWIPALDEVAKQRGWRLITLLKGACPAADVPIYNPRLKRVEGECRTWRETALARVVSMRPMAVVIGNAASYVKGHGREGGYARLTYQEWQAGIARLASRLDSAGIQTIFIRDIPQPGFDVPTCLSRLRLTGPEGSARCTVERPVAVDDELARVEGAATDGLRNVSMIDLSDQFCDSAVCPPTRGDVIVYHDSNHMTAAFSRALAPALFLALDRVMRVPAVAGIEPPPAEGQP